MNKLNQIPNLLKNHIISHAALKKCQQIGSIQLLMFYLFTASSAFAAPTISKVSRTENSLIISGSNLGSKPLAPPLRFETFSGLNGSKVVDKGWWSTKSDNPNYSPIIRSDVSRVSGRNVADLSVNNKSTLNLFKNGVGFKSTKKAYVNWWAYLDFSDFDGVAVQIKLLNLLKSVAANSDNEYPDQATSLWQTMGSQSSGTLSRYYAGGGSVPSIQYRDGDGNNVNIFNTPGWYNFAIQVDQGTQGVANGKTTMWLTGPGFTKYGVTTDAAGVMQINDNPAADYLDSIKLWQYLQFRTSFTNFVGYQGAYSGGYPVGSRVNYTNDGIAANQKGYRCIVATGPRESITVGPDVDTTHWQKISDTPLIISDIIYIDSLYIDNSFARVEVCDSPTWAARTHCEIQPATAWTDKQVTVNFNPGSFKTGQKVYVYVIDPDGNVSSDIIEYTIGTASGAATPPAQPLVPERIPGNPNG